MKQYTRIISLLTIPLLLLLGYSFCDIDMFGLEKIDVTTVKHLYAQYTEPSTSNADSLRLDSLRKDSIAKVKEKENMPDTTHQRILFIGDSMLEGLGRRLAEYCNVNDYEMTFVCWYSSTTEIWAHTDTLKHFMKEAEPTYVLICLGANEQFVRDLSKREGYIEQIINMVGDIPYVWICPPAWKEDTGINDLIRRKVTDKRFFDSRTLQFNRGKDHVHPTFNSAAVWMDEVVAWLRTPATIHPLDIKEPEGKVERKWKPYYLSPLRK